jgi:branched-chain amino acid aminotransferase
VVIKKREQVFLNGEYLDSDQANFPADSPSLLYGWGLFESMRSRGGKIIYFDLHIERIKKSCVFLGIKFTYSKNRLKKIITDTVRINGYNDSYVRLTLWKGRSKAADLLVAARKYDPFPKAKYRQGFSACLSTLRQNENSFLSRIKTTNHLLYMLSYNQALSHGFDEAILLNSRGYIAEASRSNIFFVKAKELFTPSLECGCLEGVTRRMIIDLAKKFKVNIYEGKFTLTDLYSADESFLTNSLMGVMPLISVGKKIIKNARPGKITGLMIRQTQY